MAVVVSLRSVVEEMELQNDECNAYLNRQTGALHTVQDEEADAVEEDDDTENIDDSPRDETALTREILESDDWLSLPSKFDIHEWEIMDKFALSLKDDSLQEALRGAIRGKGAFRFFKKIIHEHTIEEDWHQFRTAALEKIAIEWLDEHHISYTRD